MQRGRWTRCPQITRVRPGLHARGGQFWGHAYLDIPVQYLTAVHGACTIVHMTTLVPLYEGRLDVRLISAQALRQYMGFRGHSVRSLASKVGVSHGTIGWLTSGQRTTTKPDTARKIAKALDCPVDALFVPVVVHGARTTKGAAA